MSYLEALTKDRQANIIYILGDDHRADVMGNAGHPIVETPNLDQLAKEGVKFNNAFCTSPLCTPSRACHYLGQWERAHGVNFNSHTSVQDEAWKDSFPMQLKNRGYYLGWVGKNHVPAGSTGYDSGYFEEVFDYWYGNHNHSYFYPKEGPNGKIYSNAKKDTQIEIFAEGVNNFLEPQKDFIDQCIAPLPARPKDKPFCLCLTFNLPHDSSTESMQLRPSDDDLYKTKYRERFTEFPLPKTYKSIDEAQPRIPREIYSGEYLYNYDYVKQPVYLRERMLRVCQTVTGVDRMIGDLRNKLKELELDDNTIIVFSTDHGIHWGEHGLGGKAFLYEEDLRIPLIIYDPRMPKELRGQRIDEMTLVPDLAPTVLEMLDAPIPSSMQGSSMMPLISQEAVEWRSEFFAEQLFDKQNYPKSECVRTKDWKYIRYFKRTEDPDQIGKYMRTTLDNYQDFLEDSMNGKRTCVYEELFNLAGDPYEEANLATNPIYEEKLQYFRQKINVLGKSVLL